jgi:DNA replication and repair protein RecF
LYLHSIHLSGFRNLAEQKILFGRELNWICGDNGQGKTNLLEVIHYACMGRSQRKVREKEILSFTADTALLDAEAVKNEGPVAIHIGFNRAGEKKIQVNGKTLNKISDFLGTLNVVSFSPEDIGIVRGEPVLRRHFIDMLLAQLKPHYLKLLQEYRYFLLQRNLCLRKRENPVLCETYADKLITIGALIMEERSEGLKVISQKSGEILKNMNPGFGDLEIKYSYSFQRNASLSPQENLRDAFIKSAEREKIFGATVVGPHRDDMEFLLGEIPMRRYSSQGQCRIAAVAVKLAAVHYVQRLTGQNPILLLDDIFSELDEIISQKLRMQLRGPFQIFLASPRKEEISKEYTVFKMEAGKIETSGAE